MVEAGRINLKKAFYEELQEEISKCEDNIEERIQSFVENAIKYNGNWKNVWMVGEFGNPLLSLKLGGSNI